MPAYDSPAGQFPAANGHGAHRRMMLPGLRNTAAGNIMPCTDPRRRRKQHGSGHPEQAGVERRVAPR